MLFSSVGWVCAAVVEPVSDVAGGEVTERDAWAEGDTGAGVSAVHD